MQIYQLIKYVNKIKSSRLLALGVFGAITLHKRFAGVFIDPILSCNYRCQMCYFSDDDYRKKMHGKLSSEQILTIAHALFPHILKLQIGCGAEPSLNIIGTRQIIELGRKYQVPYISMTSNGVLLTQDILRQLIEAGLNELTISLHGIHKNTYEQLMGPTSQYDQFLQLLDNLRVIKQNFPNFVVRVNYTMNSDNVEELKDWDTIFHDIPINIVQLRPIRQIGNTKYHNFDLSHVVKCVPTIIEPLISRCKEQGITMLVTDTDYIKRFEKKQSSDIKKDLLSSYLYYYISANSQIQTSLHFKQIKRDLLKIAFYPLTRLPERDGLLNSVNYSIQ